MTRRHSRNRTSRATPLRRLAAVERAAVLPAAKTPLLILLASALLLAAAALLAGAAGATTYDGDGSAYGFVSRVDGDVLLAGLEQQDDAIEAEVNHPLLTGDQIETSSGRVELVLPDGSLVRVGRDTLVVFDLLAGSPDSESGEATLLTLDSGEIQVRTPESFPVGNDLAIRTPNATVYLSAEGTFRVSVRGASFTEVVVRGGFAEADTPNGSAVARNGDALAITGSGRPYAEVLAAGPVDSLEIWAEDLDREAYAGRTENVDPRLAHAAAPLRDSGEWIVVDAQRVWRPYVRVDWRPFRYGRWVYTPSGLTWVASAPWGWVTSHYGAWDYLPGYGWLWFPGNYYQPAAVYWYWGPTYVGWVPYGYYSRYYGSGFGIHGWAGGDWGIWGEWTFCPTRYFGRRGYDRYWDTGRNLARTRRFAVPRGIVTNDTRGINRARWGKPNEVLDTLVRRRTVAGRAGELQDVTDVIARKKLSDARLSEVRAERAASVRDRLRPLAEETNTGRFTTRTSTTTRSPVTTRTESISRGGESSVRSRTDSGSSRVLERRREIDAEGSSARQPVRRPVETTRGTEERRPLDRGEGTTRRIESDRDERDVADPPLRGRTLSTREGVTSLRDDADREEEAPARRILDRIRDYRENTRRSVAPEDESKSPPPASRSGSATSSSSSSSRRDSSASPPPRPSSRSSNSSARDSSGSSSRGSVQRSSPPPRRSSASSRSSSRSTARRPPNG